MRKATGPERGHRSCITPGYLFFVIRKDGTYKPRKEGAMRRANAPRRTAGHYLPEASQQGVSAGSLKRCFCPTAALQASQSSLSAQVTCAWQTAY